MLHTVLMRLMRKAFVQVDRAGKVIRPAQALPKEWKGQAGFDQLSNKKLAVFGWHETNLTPFQSTIARLNYDSEYKAVFTSEVQRAFGKKYLESMRTGIWRNIIAGVNIGEIRYPFNYHHQISLQTACLLGGNVTVYMGEDKQSKKLIVGEALQVLAILQDNVDTLKAEYNFYCDRMKKGFSTPEEYEEYYRAYRSAM